jgi:hypothetical protein
MIRPPLDALAAAFALGACFGAAVVLSVVLAWQGFRLLRPAVRHDRARRAEQDPPLPPAGHPEHPDKYESEWARRRFEHLATGLAARRGARRRHP